MTHLSDLAQLHPELFAQLVAFMRQAKDSGDPPSSALGALNMLAEQALMVVQSGCRACLDDVKHLHERTNDDEVATIES